MIVEFVCRDSKDVLEKARRYKEACKSVKSIEKKKEVEVNVKPEDLCKSFVKGHCISCGRYGEILKSFSSCSPDCVINTCFKCVATAMLIDKEDIRPTSTSQKTEEDIKNILNKLILLCPCCNSKVGGNNCDNIQYLDGDRFNNLIKPIKPKPKANS